MDNGGEFRSPDLDEFCNELLSRQTRTTPRTPEHNGQAERMTMELFSGHTLLADQNLTDDLWEYAANQVAHIHNRLPSRSHDPPISPYEFNRQFVIEHPIFRDSKYGK